MTGVVGWFARRPAVANLMMVLLIAAGLYAIPHTRQETLPNVPLDRISVTVTLPQATPSMVERLLCVPIEKALYGIDGLVELVSQGAEGACLVQADVEDGDDTARVLERVRSEVSRMDSLPAAASVPQVAELVVRNRVARLVLSGEQEDLALYREAMTLRRRLMASGVISVVDIENLPDREVSLQVSRDDMRRFGLSLAQMAAAISAASDARGSGVLRGEGGELLLETGRERGQPEDFLSIPVRVDEQGHILPLSRVARLHDGFHARTMAAWYDGSPAVSLDVYRVGNQHVLDVAAAVDELLNSTALPAGLRLTLWQDDAASFRERADLLRTSALQALLILAIILCLFLGLRLAFWVAVGIPVAMLGAMALLPVINESINTISLFAFILVLGIVVDDAIIVGESVDQHQRRGQDRLQDAVAGARSVARPLTYAVLTSVLAFAPLLFLPGPEGELMRVVPIVAISILLLSLLESLCILPAHLAARPARPWPGEVPLRAVATQLNEALDHFLGRIYRPLMLRLLNWRALLVAGFSAALLLALALLHSGWVDTVLFSRVDSDQVVAEVTFPQGTAPARLASELHRLQASARQLAGELETEQGGPVVAHVLAEQGVHQKISNARDPEAPYRLRVTLKLHQQATLPASRIARRWQSAHGPITSALSARFDASLLATKPDIHINLFHPDLEVLRDASADLHWALRRYAGVHQPANSMDAQRLVYEVIPSMTANRLGLGQDLLASQVADAFHGLEVDRIQEGDREVPVVLRLAQTDADTRWDLEQLPVTLPNGDVVPLAALADIRLRQAPATISHYDTRRNATVTAYVDEKATSVAAVMRDLEQGVLTELSARYPGLDWGEAGKPKAVRHFLGYLGSGYGLALVAIFFLLTVLFGNYSQPLLVMSAIPFGLVGALLGHLLLGFEVTLWSMVGVVAVSGVVVNDTLVLLDRINQRLEQGDGLERAVVEAGAERFRPIMLTSLTTFIGMAPLILASDAQSRFLVPMAISLAFGVLFATLVSLLLVPALWMLGRDSRAWLVRLWRRGQLPRAPEDTVEAAYALGQWCARHGYRVSNPYQDEVLRAAWEAGCQDEPGGIAA